MSEFLSAEERIEMEALQVAARNPATLVARSFITYRNECYELRTQRDALLAACKAALETWGDEAMYPLTTATVKAAIAKAEGDA